MRTVYLILGLAQALSAGLLFRRTLCERRWTRWALPVLLGVSGLLWLWFGVRDLLGAESLEPEPSVEALERRLADQGALLGRVEEGELLILAPAASAGARARLTEIGMVESVSPESREIALAPYEGAVLVVRGHDGGGWIYGAEIVEHAGPVLTPLVEGFYPAAE
jgi:hypothetical protein